ncbi:MATE family efflux transporter [Chondrinema litorale]|uniref:MATE family efflux transporter n=1 Tax=Chondrinema litorale TaxID=2994555 RepID=UPI002543F943|nr:MATE family efflux transporter [Chondrinema litorale]UZR93971.1 MATE family efflux transporter [Chondrinema litorale]
MRFFTLNYLKKLFNEFLIAIQGKEKNFTDGNIKRAIFMLSVPMILEMLMESLFAVVDVFFVSKVSVDAVAVVGLTESILTLIYAIGMGLSLGATAMISRRIGEKDTKAASHAAGQIVSLTMFICLTIGLFGLIYAKEILLLMGAEEALAESGLIYIQWMLGGNITILFLFLINAIFRGAGDASLAMRVLWVSNGINLILDPCLILGLGPFPQLGLEGAAIATNVGRGIGVLIQVYALTSNRSVIKIKLKDFILEKKLILRLIKLSTGGTIQFMIGSASWVFMVRIISTFGSDAVAGYTIAFRIIMFTILPSWGVANAAATLVGQNLGAKKPEMAEKAVWLASFYNMIFLGLISALFFIRANDFVGIFTSEPQVVSQATLSLKIICCGYIFFAYGMVISQSFNGAGDTFTPTLINFICYWLVQIPLAWFSSVYFGFGVAGVYFAIAFSLSLLAIISIILFRQGRWKKVMV